MTTLSTYMLFAALLAPAQESKAPQATVQPPAAKAAISESTGSEQPSPSPSDQAPVTRSSSGQVDAASKAKGEEEAKQCEQNEEACCNKKCRRRGRLRSRCRPRGRRRCGR